MPGLVIITQGDKVTVIGTMSGELWPQVLEMPFDALGPLNGFPQRQRQPGKALL